MYYDEHAIVCAEQILLIRKEEEQERKLYELIEKCDNEIEHYTIMAKTLREMRDSMQAEIDFITETTSAKIRRDWLLENQDYLKKKYGTGKFANLYSDVASHLVGTDEKKMEKENAKLLKRKESLKNKLLSLDNKIFSAEQKIKSAKAKKYNAECKLGI